MAIAQSNSVLNIGLGILGGAKGAWDSGVAKVDEAKEAKTMREERRAKALRDQQVGNYKLAEMGRKDQLASATQDQEIAYQQAKIAEQTRTIKRVYNKQTTGDTLVVMDLTLETGEPDAINRYIAENPDEANRTFKGTLRVEKLDLSSNADRQMILNSGVAQEELDAYDGNVDGNIDWDKLKSRFFKAIQRDGTVGVADIYKTAVMQGYTKYKDKEKIDRLDRLADITKKTKVAQPKPTPEERNVEAGFEASKVLKSGKSPETGKPLTEPETTYYQNLAAVAEREGAGVGAGASYKTTEAINDWYANGFDMMSQEELQKDREAGILVRTIERTKGLDKADRKDLKELAPMISLLNEAGTLSEEQTGLLDKLTSGLMAYVDSDTVTAQAKRAYQSLISVFRHNIAGAALTEYEIKAFEQAYSSDSRKIGHVLAGMKSMATQLQAKLDTISDLNSPELAQYYFGDTLDKMQRTKAGIELRLQYLNLIEDGLSPREAADALEATGSGTDYMDRPVMQNGRAVKDETPTLGKGATKDEVLNALFGN